MPFLYLKKKKLLREREGMILDGLLLVRDKNNLAPTAGEKSRFGRQTSHILICLILLKP